MNEPLAQVGLLAHSLNEAGKRQTLAEHLKNVAALAETFAAGFDEEATARFVALVHDIGKAKGTWQERLMQLEAGLKPAFDEIKSDHKMAGAAHAYSFSAAAALIVAGHHGGIPDLALLKQEIVSGKWDASRTEALNSLADLGLEAPSLVGDIAQDYFRILMLFSCLVDADSIDTSSHFLQRLETPQFDSLSIL